jgi:hypothetical protein
MITNTNHEDGGNAGSETLVSSHQTTRRINPKNPRFQSHRLICHFTICVTDKQSLNNLEIKKPTDINIMHIAELKKLTNKGNGSKAGPVLKQLLKCRKVR